MRRVLRWMVPIVFYVALAVFLVIYLMSIDYDTLLSIEFDWWFIAIATFIGIANRYWMVLIWLTILRGLGAGRFENVPALAHVYAKSWLGRYIPGTAPWILGKIYFASRQGLSKSKLAVSSFLEAGLQVLVLLVVGILMLVIDPRSELVAPWMKWLMAGLALIGVVLIWPPVFNRLARFAFLLIRKRKLDAEHLPSLSTMGKGAGLYVVGALLTGTTVFFVGKAVWPELPYSELLFCIGAMNLASAVSMLAVFAPSGIGVREAILVALLSIVMPTELALVTSVAVRLWSIGADFLFLGITRLTLSARRSALKKAV